MCIRDSGPSLPYGPTAGAPGLCPAGFKGCGARVSPTCRVGGGGSKVRATCLRAVGVVLGPGKSRTALPTRWPRGFQSPRPQRGGRLGAASRCGVV
eukprot:777964-Pyramimonas_sp.AAC.1